MKFKGTFRRMSPQQMSTMIKANVTPLVKFNQTKEVSVTYIQLNTIYAYYLGHAKHTKEKCSHHSVGKPVCASYPVTECLPIRKRHECINNIHTTTVKMFWGHTIFITIFTCKLK